MSAMIPNIPKRKQLTRIKLEAIQLPNNDTTKTIAIKPFQLLHIRNSSVACSKNLLRNPFFLPEKIQKIDVCIQISILKNSNRGQLRSCEDIIFVA